nr:hypothetical protein CFP56_33580 [Quercus suber]
MEDTKLVTADVETTTGTDVVATIDEIIDTAEVGTTMVVKLTPPEAPRVSEAVTIPDRGSLLGIDTVTLGNAETMLETADVGTTIAVKLADVGTTTDGVVATIEETTETTDVGTTMVVKPTETLPRVTVGRAASDVLGSVTPLVDSTEEITEMAEVGTTIAVKLVEVGIATEVVWTTTEETIDIAEVGITMVVSPVVSPEAPMVAVAIADTEALTVTGTVIPPADNAEEMAETAVVGTTTAVKLDVGKMADVVVNEVVKEATTPEMVVECAVVVASVVAVVAQPPPKGRTLHVTTEATVAMI